MINKGVHGEKGGKETGGKMSFNRFLDAFSYRVRAEEITKSNYRWGRGSKRQGNEREKMERRRFVGALYLNERVQLLLRRSTSRSRKGKMRGGIAGEHRNPR